MFRCILRYLFTILSVASLLLCAAAVLLRLVLAEMREARLVWDGSPFHIGRHELVVLWIPIDYFLVATIAALLPAWWVARTWRHFEPIGGKRNGRQQLHRAFVICTAISLTLILVVTALWVRSFSTAERVNVYGSSKWLGVMSTEGSLIVQYVGDATIAEDADWFTLNRWHPSEVRQLDPRRGRGPAAYHLAAHPRDMSTLSVSYGLITLLLLIPSCIKLLATLRGAIHAYRQWRLPKPGTCSVCGYDLRASPERCPECGTAVQAIARVENAVG